MAIISHMNSTLNRIHKVSEDAGLDPNVAHIMQHIETYTQRVEKLIQHLQLSIPKYVDEYLYGQGLTTLTVNPQSQNLEMILSIIAVVSTPAGGTLTLGSGGIGTPRTIPLPMGVTTFNFTGSGMLLTNNDLRQITQANAGTIGLELLGVELVDKGVF